MVLFSIIGTIWPSAFWIIFLISALYFTSFYLIYVRQTQRWKKSNIPYVHPTFLIGHKYILNIRNYCLMVPLDQLYSENNDKQLFGFFLGPFPMILLKDPTLIHQVFVKNSNRTFSTGLATPETEVEAQYMINSSTDEEKWKFARTALAPIFAPTWYQGARFERINEAVHELLRNIESQGRQIDVKEIIEDTVFSVVSSNFGAESNSHTIKDGVSQAVQELFEITFLRAISAFSLAFFPFLQRFKPFKALPRKTLDRMSEILKQQIKQRDQMKTKKDDLIDILRSLQGKLESRNNGRMDIASINTNEEINMRKMTGLGLTVAAGGSETVSSLIQFAIHALSLYPEYQRKIRKEVQDTLRRHGVTDFNYEVVRDLSFTIKCLCEVARLYPTGPMLMRKSSDDFQISGTSYTFRKGDLFILPMYSVNRDPKIFKDPHLFNPERFESVNSNINIPNSLLSFGTGPRKCPGYKHGLILAATILASIVCKHDVKPNSHLKLMDCTDFNPKGFTTSPRKNIVVDLFPADNFNNK